ncbi:MAG: glycosyltransferase [Nanoarchaeota archaeon]
MTKYSKVIFASFSPWENGHRSPTNGLIEPMVSYFAPRVNKFILIDQPHPGSDRLIPTIETYSKGKLKKTTRSSFFVSLLYPILLLQNTLKTSIVFKIRDFLSVIDFGLWSKDYFDLFIGLESINTLAGVILKKIGLVKTVVYYVSDFSLQRYGNSLLNKIYLFLDRIAFNNADFVWDISPAMMPARLKIGSISSDKVSLYVPIALFENQVTHKTNDQTIPYSLVYAGLVNSENGPDLAIQVLKKVLHSFPKTQLHIFAAGQDSEIQNLRDLTNKLSVQNKVFIHGFITNQTELINDLSQFKIGLAPYVAKKNSARWWSDSTRIRLYLAASLPVITTQVPPMGKELESNGSGLVVNGNVTHLTNAVISLFKNSSQYNKMKFNAMKQAENNTWDKVYNRTLKSMNIELKK